MSAAYSFDFETPAFCLVTSKPDLLVRISIPTEIGDD